MKTDNKLSSYIHDFLQEYLPLQKGFSRHTVLSYRDTIKLFLTFSADHKKKSVTDLTVADLGAAMVVDFLDHWKRSGKTAVKPETSDWLACTLSFGTWPGTIR